MQSKSIVQFIFGALVSGIVLYFLFDALQLTAEVPVDGQAPGQASIAESFGLLIRKIDPILLALFVSVYAINLLVRASRYRLLLLICADPHTPNFGQMVVITALRNMMAGIIPARLGELTFVALVNRLHGVNIASASSTLGVSLVFDFIALLAIISVLVLFQIAHAGMHDWLLSGLSISLLASLTASLFAWLSLFYLVPWLCVKIEERGPLRSSKLWQTKIVNFLLLFNENVQRVASAGRSFVITMLSVLIRVLKYIGLSLLFVALSVHSFPEIAAIPAADLVAVLIGGELASSLPLPNLMGFGLYEAGGAAMFHVIGVVSVSSAVLVLLVSHMFTKIVDFSLASLAILWLLLKKRKFSA